MATSIFDPQLAQARADAREAFLTGATRTVMVDGAPRTFPFPYPSPTDWRETWIYFLMVDRFNNPEQPPNSGRWDQRYGFRQGGTFAGVRDQLGYLENLGARAIWLSPVLKNPKPAAWEFNYHGYATQDFLNLDERFASDGTLPTAEREFQELVDEAHARGLHVILDIVLNHSARVFDYLRNGQTEADFSDAGIMSGPLGSEPPVEWLNGFGFPRGDWTPDLPAAANLSADDGVWPVEFQRKEFFRRRGDKLTDNPGDSFVRGDFGSMRQLVPEYDAGAPGLEPLQERFGRYPMLQLLVQAHAYLIARYDIDGFRIDTVKYVAPAIIESFCNAMREFALSVGKRNFFTFGEVYDEESVVNRFVGRHADAGEGFGMDAALDFPLFFRLPKVIKGSLGVETLRDVFAARKAAEEHTISSHGEAGKYFVTFLDNHDQNERFFHPATPANQVTQGLAVLFCLQGIPCLYYGTEQGLNGAKHDDGTPDLGSMESIREALWGKPQAFDRNDFWYAEVQKLAGLRRELPALSYGRIYPREVSGNGTDFGQSTGPGGIIAFSRILADQEVLMVANTGSAPFHGEVLVDLDLARQTGGANRAIRYSNLGTAGERTLRVKPATAWSAASPSNGTIAAVDVELQPSEAQILTPA